MISPGLGNSTSNWSKNRLKFENRYFSMFNKFLSRGKRVYFDFYQKFAKKILYIT